MNFSYSHLHDGHTAGEVGIIYMCSLYVPMSVFSLSLSLSLCMCVCVCQSVKSANHKSEIDVIIGRKYVLW